MSGPPNPTGNGSIHGGEDWSSPVSPVSPVAPADDHRWYIVTELKDTGKKGLNVIKRTMSMSSAASNSPYRRRSGMSALSTISKIFGSNSRSKVQKKGCCEQHGKADCSICAVHVGGPNRNLLEWRDNPVSPEDIPCRWLIGREAWFHPDTDEQMTDTLSQRKRGSSSAQKNGGGGGGGGGSNTRPTSMHLPATEAEADAPMFEAKRRWFHTCRDCNLTWLRGHDGQAVERHCSHVAFAHHNLRTLTVWVDGVMQRDGQGQNEGIFAVDFGAGSPFNLAETVWDYSQCDAGDADQCELLMQVTALRRALRQVATSVLPYRRRVVDELCVSNSHRFIQDIKTFRLLVGSTFQCVFKLIVITLSEVGKLTEFEKSLHGLLRDDIEWLARLGVQIKWFVGDPKKNAGDFYAKCPLFRGSRSGDAGMTTFRAASGSREPIQEEEGPTGPVF